MRSKHEGYDSVRTKVLAAAAVLFTKTGVHGTSLMDIAVATGVAKGTVYYYYPAKETLVADVARIHCDAVMDALLNWAEGISRDDDPKDQLSVAARALLSDEQRRKLHVVLCAEGSLDDPSLCALLGSAMSEWTMVFEVGALKLRLPESRKVRERAQLFFTIISGYMLRPEITENDIADIVKLMMS